MLLLLSFLLGVWRGGDRLPNGLVQQSPHSSEGDESGKGWLSLGEEAAETDAAVGFELLFSSGRGQWRSWLCAKEVVRWML